MSDINQCYVCFQTGESEVVCVNQDIDKVVRKYMHPTDNIKFTMWLFDAKIQCLNKNKNWQVAQVLKNMGANENGTVVFKDD